MRLVTRSALAPGRTGRDGAAAAQPDAAAASSAHAARDRAIGQGLEDTPPPLRPGAAPFKRRLPGLGARGAGRAPEPRMSKTARPARAQILYEARMRPLLIVNPRSAGGKTGEIFDQMREPIRRALGEFDVQCTEGPRHASDLARAAALEGRETVVAVGGDGCIHEVVNGLMQARAQGAASTRMGIIGQGTGGDFRKTLGLEHRLDRYCATIARGETRRIDVGRFSYRTHHGAEAEAYFVNILSAGIGGLVDRIVSETSKALGGTIAYLGASVRGLIESRVGRLRCRITLDGEAREEEISTRNIAVCNGRYFGSGMKVAPMAELDDGLFEVVDLGDAPRLRFFLASSRLYTGKHIGHPDVRHFRCQRLEMELLNQDAADHFLLDVDGEPLGRLPISISVEPRALEVLAPAR